MYKEIINKIKPHLDKTLEYLKSELNGLQVGRASPSLVEDLEVDCYGGKMPLKQLAAIHAPEPRQIIIQPWDKNILKEIETAVSHSKLGLTPTIDGEAIRLNIPPLNEERRKELAKIIREKIEECRIAIRRKREEVWKEIQILEQGGKIREDDKFRAKDELQEMVDEYNEKIEEISKRKEEEIMRV
ncbi:MAG: ribosome recycling factor [Candidatus Portnoybacteria bacterium RIFCSPLOWO2_12_FULL_39_9]|uniref:Ribosome-recycling factor n=1 Tax=Candidatus Portnoybacteria bacterium RIFCSPHIGHO2_12_FULL_38_9 TaxID=1801997 RepID=A0A1G2FH07_9BACT|nr:MAG: ribosome recycling factor [Candidatus Portnoybacteria bacterium RBG_13_40_8]OGZ36425.1 MAG: ribosome recycling factor [Candidatus Portnoybacteria bacterium RIFCSPHIGHO2_02_FULL_39_12]OGZ37364.1 MAG: ribosome recycling factor [Candidatus Portnoybacteria bacterium RIFCSPHIGHO2_12_FULL_38_9]OGZ39324.1 MAG: ribosome recycling factor [Candidatus Portnoybacteria bacterium RIFCSPLOWO2_01_FULL_38_39]OGZ40995.1 MAG: ribosome recycling factor [Candidatus Portnoybacteria bacterium RIFCSPLOWO2_12_F